MSTARLSVSTAHYQRNPLVWALLQALMRLQVRRTEQMPMAFDEISTGRAK